MSLRLFKSQFRVDDITRLCQNFKILRKRFHKLIIHFKISYTCYFHVSINIGTRNTNLNLFDPVFLLRRHPGESKVQNFETLVSKTNTLPQIFLHCWFSSFCHVSIIIFRESDLRNKFLSSKFHEKLISIFLSLSIKDIQLWALFTQFGDNDVAKEINIPEFWKINFVLLKMQIAGIMEVSVLIWSRYITWKLLGKLWKMTSWRGLCFTTFPKHFTKIL